MSIRREIKDASRVLDKNEKKYSSSWTLMDKSEEILSVEESAVNKDVHIRLSGNLRSDTVFFFKDELLALATTDSDVTLDCEALTGISNVCQKGLIETQQLMDSLGRGTLTLVKLPAQILEDFQSSGVAGALNIE